MLEANLDGRRTPRRPMPDEEAPAAGCATPAGPVEVDDRQAGAAVELLVVGSSAARRSLPQQLPAVWQVRWASFDAQAGQVDIVLLADPHAGHGACLEHVDDCPCRGVAGDGAEDY